LCILQNLFLSAIWFTLAVIAFWCFSLIDPYYTMHLELHNSIFFFLFLFLTSFYRNRLSITIALAVVYLIALLQMVHIRYFGSWIYPIEFIMLGKNLDEVTGASSAYLPLIWLPLFLNFGFFLASVLPITKFKRRLTIHYALFLLIPLLASIPVTYYYRPDSYAFIQDIQANPVINAYKSFSYFISKVLVQKIKGTDRLEQPLMPALKKRIIKPKFNVIFIMGESLTDRHMSLYGYKRRTTPYLATLHHQPNVLVEKGISAGVATSISLPTLFNMVNKPSGVAQITLRARNLFKLAKANGFVTYFISSQSADDLRFVKPNLGISYIDHLADSSYFGAGYRENILDYHLLDYLKTINLAQPGFIVLHQRGSHAPYNKRYPKQFDIFKNGADDLMKIQQVNAYDNSVRYTDFILHKIINYVRAHTKLPTYIVFTSDHGESLGYHGVFGHTNLYIPQEHNVPIIIIALHGASLTFITKAQLHEINPSYMSHYELSKIIATMLGYRVPHLLNQSNGYYVNGNDLHGTVGYLHLHCEKKELSKK